MREGEKSKSVLYKTRTTMPSGDYGSMNGGSSAEGASKDYRGTSSHTRDESSAAIEQQLDPEQLQLFAQENQDMLKQYEDQLDKVRYVALSLSYKTTANQMLVLQRSHSWKSQSCSRRLPAISRSSQHTSSSSWRIHSIRRKTSGAGTGSSGGQRREGAQRSWSFTLRLDSAHFLFCGICSYDRCSLQNSMWSGAH